MAVRSFVPLISACFLIIIIIPVLSIPALLGIHPLDEKYFVSESIECKDGSKSFSRDRINDDFCDCVDGTDEPGTSACPLGKFYCRNVGSTPRFLFSSRVNDQICDCCDGSDEYDGSVNCLNTCIMGGNVLYKMGTYSTKVSTLGSVDAKETKSNALEDVIQKLKGLKLVLILQLVLIILLVALWLFQRRRIRSKRRRYR